VISELANLHHQGGATTEAEALYREALEAQRRGHREGHSSVGTDVDSLASLLHQTGLHAEVEA
jgi:hypothetical protein